MADATSMSPLVAVLAELGWKPEVLARRLNNFAAMHGRGERLHIKTPYKWLHGTEPHSPWPALAAALMTGELGRLITPAELGWRKDVIEALSAIGGLVLPWTVAGSLHAIRVVSDPGNMDRRIFITLLGAGASAPAHEGLLARPDTVLAKSSGRSVPMTIVDQFDDVTAQLRRMDDQLGGALVLPMVRDQLRHVLRVLDQRSYTDTIGRRLHAAAELMRLAGTLAFDGSHHPQAQRYWIAALHAAHAAGDRALGANIVGFMSEQAKLLGQIRAAVTLAETARTGYPGATPRVAALCNLRAAQAYAYDQATTECHRALNTAFDQLGDPPSSWGEPAWCYWLDEADAHTQAGNCYLQLQDWNRACHHYHAALRLQDPSYVRENARRHIKLATTYLLQGQPEVDHAIALATPAVDALTNQVSSARVVSHLARFVGHLGPYRRRPAVRELTDRAAGLLASA